MGRARSNSLTGSCQNINIPVSNNNVTVHIKEGNFIIFILFSHTYFLFLCSICVDEIKTECNGNDNHNISVEDSKKRQRVEL